MQNIMLLELYPIVIALETWSTEMQNKKLVIHTDNLALVAVLRKQTSKDNITMCLVRRLVLVCLCMNILLHVLHVPGVQNGPADALSRLQVDKFRALCPTANRAPAAIPPLPESIN
jgi:hypothetical protein